MQRFCDPGDQLSAQRPTIRGVRLCEVISEELRYPMAWMQYRGLYPVIFVFWYFVLTPECHIQRPRARQTPALVLDRRLSIFLYT